MNFGNKGGLVLLYQGDPALFNQYAYLPINPSKNSYIRNDLAMQLEDWLTSQKASTLIDDYQDRWRETVYVQRILALISDYVVHHPDGRGRQTA